MTVKSCLKSMRLRTLPLSLAGVVMGISLALDVCAPSFLTVLFLILTTCSLQILSNLSNELGDTLSGTDTAEREGVHYAVQDGEMTVPQLKRLIFSVAVCCCVFGATMIYFAFGTLFCVYSIAFLVLGACAIVAAMRYTLGPKPYGYRGLGDFYVFIFFGLVSTLGGFVICYPDVLFLAPSAALSALLPAVLPACGIGCFSVGVLNVNNIRDMKTDSATRITVALKLGLHRARVYQTILISCGWVCLVASTVIFGGSFWYLLALPLFVLHLRGVWTRTARSLDPMLPLLVLSTFIVSLLWLL